MRKPADLIVLDRDGVINADSDNFIRSVEQWQPLPGSIEAMAKLFHAGFKLAVATNQSGIARGYYSLQTLHDMHAKMQSLLAAHGAKVDCIQYCPHGPDAGCECRKPLPGLLQKIGAELNLSVAGCDMVGDSLRDLQAAEAVNARPVLVLTGKGQKTLQQLPEGHHSRVYPDLAAYAVAKLKEHLHA